MGLFEDGTEYYRSILKKCDNSSTFMWLKDPAPEYSKSVGATLMQHTSGNRYLAVDWNFFDREYKIVLNKFQYFQRNQQWKMTEQGQFVNVEAQLCLTIYSSSKILPSKSTNYQYGMKKCSMGNQEIVAQQKWSVVLLPRCPIP